MAGKASAGNKNSEGEAEQLALAGLAPRKRRKRKPKERHPAKNNPIVQVVLDIQATHLGTPFDYLIEEKDSEAARPGVMVRVRFGGQRVNGIIWARVASSHTQASALRYIERVVSPEILVSASMRRDITLIAQAYGGTPANILRLAVPPRVARVDKEQQLAALGEGLVSAQDDDAGGSDDDETGRSEVHGITGIGDFTAAGTALVRRHIDTVLLGSEFSRMQAEYDAATQLRDGLASSGFSSFVFDPLPGPGQWARDAAWMAVQALATGRGMVLVLPTVREVNDMMQALEQYGLQPFARTKATHGGYAGDVAQLSASMAPAERYRSYLAVATGQVRCVIGTRAAMYAPVEGEALFALVEDNAYQYADGMMPYAQARGVLRLRARAHGGTFVALANARSVVSQWECGFEESAGRRDSDDADGVGGAALDGNGDDGAASEDVAAAVNGTGTEPYAPQENGVTGPSVSVHPVPSAVHTAVPWTRWFNRDELSRLADSTIGARVPHIAVHILSEALERGPVLFSIPRDGVASALSCCHCHRQARCPRCTGPLQQVRGQAPRCAWCGAVSANWVCPACKHDRLRVVRVGAAGTAQELQQLFHSVDMVVSSPQQPGGIVHSLPDRYASTGWKKTHRSSNIQHDQSVPSPEMGNSHPLIVIATPGAEPRISGGYRAVAILDAWTSLYSQSLDARPDVLTAWMRAVSMCVPRAAGGQALLLGETDPVIARSLLLWDSRILAADELDARLETGLPPICAAAAVWGRRTAVDQTLRRIGAVDGDFAAIEFSDGSQPSVLGPVPMSQPRTMDARELEATQDRVKAIVRVPQGLRSVLATRLHDASALHVAKREPGELRFALDPKDLD